MKKEYDFESLIRKMTNDQQTIFLSNLDLWKKTAEMNNRPQHFDSFDVDLSMLLQEWYYLLEDINSLDFAENLSQNDFCKKNTIINENITENHTLIKNQNSSAISPTMRFEILKRDGFRCQLCGATAKHRARLEIDHKVSKKDGGTDDKDNLWTLCFNCNRGKGGKSM